MSRICMMSMDKYFNFGSDFFNKYATLDYYLSKGAAGNVYGPIPWHGVQVAIKQSMYIDDKVTDIFRKKLEVMKDIWTSLDHKNLMRIFRVDLSRLPKAMFIVMEFAAGGSLNRTLRSIGSGNKLPIDVVTDWAKQIADGMLYLHQRNIVHRDLKSSNILLMEPFDIRTSCTIMTLKITDFDEVKERDHTTTMSSLVGTFAYMAPEVLVNERFSKASDVWSYGVVVWEMLSGDIPHQDLEPRAIMQKSSNGKLDKLPLQQSFPEHYKLLLSRCWKSECRERLSFGEILSFFKQMEFLHHEGDERQTFDGILSTFQYSHSPSEKILKEVEGAVSMESVTEFSDLGHRRLDKPASFTLFEKIKRLFSGGGDSRTCRSSNEVTVDSKFRKMGVDKSMKPAVLDKYATTTYFINRGASGNVYGPIPWQGSQLAIKQVLFADDKVTVDFKKRVEEKKVIWNSLEHKNLMRIHWVDLTRLPKVMFVVMDYAGGGSLHKTLRSLGPENRLPIDVVTDWAKQITDGMLYLHEKDIVHRVLKSSNILLMEPFNSRHPHTILTLKIADFDEVKDHDHTATMSTFVGTYAYMAPEVLNDQWFSKASDVWSFGVVIWEMLSGDIPHRGLEPSTIMSKSVNGKLDNLHVEPSFPEDYRLLLNRCWESTHSERISFHDIYCILQHIDKLREKYKSDPVLIEMIRTGTSKHGKAWICGLAILNNELFVANGRCQQIEVYDSIKLSFSRRLKLKKLVDPWDIVSCSSNKCLYIFDHKVSEPSHEILRVDPNGKLITKWFTEADDGYSLSVTNESNVILTVYHKHKLLEYSPDGQLIRKINLADAGIDYPLHAVKLANGHFVVSHGSYDDDDLHRVCIVDSDGKLVKAFGGKRGSDNGQMCRPVYLSVDGNGFVFVADQGNRRVLLFNSNLNFEREIVAKRRHGLQIPRILLDESTSRLVVAESEWGVVGLLLIFQF